MAADWSVVTDWSRISRSWLGVLRLVSVFAGLLRNSTTCLRLRSLVSEFNGEAAAAAPASEMQQQCSISESAAAASQVCSAVAAAAAEQLQGNGNGDIAPGVSVSEGDEICEG